MGSLGRIKDYNKIQAITELYLAIQSEGSRAGYPTVVVRTTGCTHRCIFRDGGVCDSWYTSIKPEKAKFSFNDIVKMYDENPQIKEMMLTGGSPTMWPALMNELTIFAEERDIVITLESEGSHYVETTYPIGLYSLSPKFTNSIPQLGEYVEDLDITVDEKLIKQHNKFRMNVGNMAKMINASNDFHLKPVFDPKLSIKDEFYYFIEKLSYELSLLGYKSFKNPLEIEKYLLSKTWVMVAGGTREEVIENSPSVIDFCIKENLKFIARDHILIFDSKREV